MIRRLVACAALVSLAACGGGGGGSVPASAPAKTQAKAQAGSVLISIPTSSAGSSSKVRYPQFISPNASSVTLSVNGGAVQTFDVSATSSLCTTVASARNCTISFAAAVGSDTLAFIIYSGPNGTGSNLASATTTQTVVAGSPFTFTLAMNAAVGTIVATLIPNHGTSGCENTPPQMMGISEGCAGTGTLSIAVDDPSGAPITGTTPFATPIQFSSNDPSLTASPSQITMPGQSITLMYSGATLGPTITTSIAISLTAGTQVTTWPLAAARSYLYVANSNATEGTNPPGGGNIAVYTFGASASATPARTIFGPATQLSNPVMPLVDSAGNLYVLDNGPYTTQSNPVILVFAPRANGNATPVREITGLASVTSNEGCQSMVFDPTGAYLFVTCDDGKIHVFPASTGGGALTLQAASLVSSTLYFPTGLAFDASGNLYVGDASENAIEYFPGPLPTSGTSVNITATQTMSAPGSWPAAVQPTGLALDDQGTLFATIVFQSPTSGPPDANNQIAIWRTTSIPCPSCTPTTTLTGPTMVHDPAGITYDAAGNLYVSNPFADTVTEYTYATAYAAGPSASPAVLRQISTGSSPGGPVGLAVGP